MNQTVKKTFGAATLAASLLTPTLAPEVEAQQVSARYNGGAKFQHTISSNTTPGSRVITVDCSRLEPVRLQNGSTGLAVTVSFVDLFNLLNAEGMANYSPAQKQAIEQAGSNRSVAGDQVAFMVSHVVSAHGVKYPEIKSAGEQCKARATLQ